MCLIWQKIVHPSSKKNSHLIIRYWSAKRTQCYPKGAVWMTQVKCFLTSDWRAFWGYINNLGANWDPCAAFELLLLLSVVLSIDRSSKAIETLPDGIVVHKRKSHSVLEILLAPSILCDASTRLISSSKSYYIGSRCIIICEKWSSDWKEGEKWSVYVLSSWYISNSIYNWRLGISETFFLKEVQ